MVLILLFYLQMLFMSINHRTEVAAISADSRPKVLFITNPEFGHANVHLATAMSLRRHHSAIDVHLASFARLEKAVNVASQASNTVSSSTRITFHPINALSYAGALEHANLTNSVGIRHPPGWAGQSEFASNLDTFLLPWNVSTYTTAYKETRRVIDSVDPDVLVVDILYLPGIDAAEASGRQIIYLSPNTIAATFAPRSPLKMFFEYPALASGYSWPISWWQTPANIHMMLRLIYATLVAPRTGSIKTSLQKEGMISSVQTTDLHRSKWPFIVASKQYLEYPLDIPANVIEAGPILLDQTSTLEQQDPELASWLIKRPTILINLGSHVCYSQANAEAIVLALKPFLDQQSIQVLWKFNKDSDYDDESFSSHVKTHIDNGDLRLQPWIEPDIISLLQSGNIVAMVHHAGGNSFNEALASGIPQIALPMWADCYDYAVRIEWLGVGIWASRTSAPELSSTELENAFHRVLGGGSNTQMLGQGEESQKLKTKAMEFKEKLATDPAGRDLAADTIVKVLNEHTKQIKPAEQKDEL